jgi:cytochrome c2
MQVLKQTTLPAALLKTIMLGIGVCFLMACNREAPGFALPEGDIENGKFAYTQLSCNQCHSVADIAWAGSASGDQIDIKLGGEVSKIKTYANLVTSIINPSHSIDRKYLEEPYASNGESRMRKYNEFMTVQDLVDIVTYLQSEYKVIAPENDYYPVF